MSTERIKNVIVLYHWFLLCQSGLQFQPVVHNIMHLGQFFCIPVSLHDEEVFPWSLLDGVLKLFVEGFCHTVVVVRCWSIYLDNVDVLRFSGDSYGYQPA